MDVGLMISFYQSCLILGIVLTVVFFFFGDMVDIESPIDLSALITWMTVFGATGSVLIDGYWTSSEDALLVILSSALVATLISVAFYLLYLKPMKKTENSVAFSYQDLVGKTGEVITPITTGKYGEVVLQMGAGYTNQIATSHQEITKETKVVVKTVQEGIVWVEVLDQKGDE